VLVFSAKSSHLLSVAPLQLCLLKAMVAPRIIMHRSAVAAGAEQFEALSRMYSHGSRAAIVCFDASGASSFDKLKFWVRLAHPSDAMIGPFSCCM